jgi:hypothetical protein
VKLRTNGESDVDKTPKSTVERIQRESVGNHRVLHMSLEDED